MTQPVDLDALLGVAGQVKVGGAVYDVRPLDGAGYRLWGKVVGGGAGAVVMPEILYSTAGRCVPTMDQETVDRLSPEQAMTILTIAAGHVKLVEQSDPNVKRPARRRKRPASFRTTP